MQKSKRAHRKIVKYVKKVRVEMLKPKEEAPKEPSRNDELSKRLIMLEDKVDKLRFIIDTNPSLSELILDVKMYSNKYGIIYRGSYSNLWAKFTADHIFIYNKRLRSLLERCKEYKGLFSNS